MRIIAILPIAAAIALVAGCGVTENLVRQEVTDSERRTDDKIAQAASRIENRLMRYDADLSQVRNEVQTESEARRRMLIDVLSRQRDAVLAQLRVLDDAIAGLGSGRSSGPLAATPRLP